MPGRITTTQTFDNFRKEDITYKKARRQSEIADELDKGEIVGEVNVEVPTSSTPEQLIAFYKDMSKSAKTKAEKNIYSQTAKMIQRMQTLEQELVQYKAKPVPEKKEANDDIE